MKHDEPTMNDWLFIGEYVKDWNATQALKRSGVYVGDFAGNEACRRMRKPAVQAEIEKVRASIREKVQLTTNLVAQDIVNVLTADPRDLFEIVTVSCRYCHGEDHLYQRTKGEYNLDRFKADATGKLASFDHQGGIGFNPYRDPHPDCPECHGKGQVEERIKDTRFLSPEVAALYMGGKRGKNGLEIIMRSKDSAREAAAKWLGMNKETHIHKNLADMSDAELEAIAKGEKK